MLEWIMNGYILPVTIRLTEDALLTMTCGGMHGKETASVSVPDHI